MQLYAIYDKVAQESGPLFEAKNNTVALRMFKSVGLPGNPEDYKLLLLGSYSHDPVRLDALSTPLDVFEAAKAVEDN